jgi:hypothetical protein
MSIQNNRVKEKNEDERKNLPYWAVEVLKMWEESERKQDARVPRARQALA